MTTPIGAAIDPEKPSIADASRLCRHALPTSLLFSSEAVDWTSALVEVNRADASWEPFETHPTGDQTIVMVLRNEQQLGAFRGGSWHDAIYRAGTIGMNPPHETSRLRRRVSGQPVDKVNLYMPERFLLEAADHYRRAGQKPVSTRLSSLAFRDPAIEQTIIALIRAVRAGAADLYAETAMRWLAAHLLAKHVPRRSVEDHDRVRETIPRPRLADLLEHMQANLHQPLTLDRLAAEAYVSKYHFARLFRAQTGKSPHAYLTELRMEAARHLLMTTDLSVAEIARRCGYRQPAHFATAFKAREGIPPTLYRRGSRSRVQVPVLGGGPSACLRPTLDQPAT